MAFNFFLLSSGIIMYAKNLKSYEAYFKKNAIGLFSCKRSRKRLNKFPLYLDHHSPAVGPTLASHHEGKVCLSIGLLAVRDSAVGEVALRVIALLGCFVHLISGAVKR